MDKAPLSSTRALLITQVIIWTIVFVVFFVLSQGVQSFRALWGEDVVAEGTSRVTWEIEPVGDSCRLTVTHDQLREDANDQLYGGWPMILSGLKTWLETGQTLTTPGSLMYGSGE